MIGWAVLLAYFAALGGFVLGRRAERGSEDRRQRDLRTLATYMRELTSTGENL